MAVQSMKYSLQLKHTTADRHLQPRSNKPMMEQVADDPGTAQRPSTLHPSTLHPSTLHPSRKLYQWLAVAVCLLLALAMIVNTQLGGEGMWFWYATIFHNGTKMYSGMHSALQPLFMMETDAWMTLFGHKIIVTQIPSVLRAMIVCGGLLLVLRESDWPDWQKACILLGAFAFTVAGSSYRFDDYHVEAEAYILYSFLLLLVISRTLALRRQLGLVALLGLIAGMTITTRLTDGAALLTSAALSLLFLPGSRKALRLALFLGVAALTVASIVGLTGDTFSDYVSNSIIRAAGSKGGTGSIFAAPLHMFLNTIPMLRDLDKRLAGLILLVCIGALIARFWKRAVPYIVPLQLAVVLLVFAVMSPGKRLDMMQGSLINTLVLFLTQAMYVMAAIMIVRLVRFKMGRGSWDPREVLILLPIAEWASYSAGAAAYPLTSYYAPVALLLLLVPIVQPFRRFASWANPALVTIMLLVGITGIVSKVMLPYSWQNYRYGPMFVNRQWYHHPVYGEMYIDSDLLRFSQSVCHDIEPVPRATRPELLSIPYPYPNYFCNTPPWHNYVQTFFDTSTRATIETLIQQLDTAPPQFIVYQRQLNIMQGMEFYYNHGKPLPQRDLDELILGKVKSGQWKLLEKSPYLTPYKHDPEETSWYIIQTRP
jgi:hypothetical protein